MPLQEYRLCRDYVLAVDEEMREAANKTDLDTETWGNEEVAQAPWNSEVVTSLK